MNENIDIKDFVDTQADIDTEAEKLEAQLKEWNDRAVKISNIIFKIETGQTIVKNKEKILSYLRFVILTLDLAMEGDETAMKMLKMEKKTAEAAKNRLVHNN